jgi:hypothetical protein
MSAPATSLTSTNSLLTGTEWNSAQIRNLFHLARNLKLHRACVREALIAHARDV